MRHEDVLSGGAPVPEQLVIEPLEDVAGFRVSGELDLLTVPQLRAALISVGRSSSDTVLDLSGVTFVDSSGLGLFLSTARTTQERGGSLVLRTLSPAVRRLFGIAIPNGAPGLVLEQDQGSA